MVILHGGFEGIGDKNLDGLLAEAEKGWELEVEECESPFLKIDPVLAQSVLVWRGRWIFRSFVRHPRYTACTSTVEVRIQEFQVKFEEDLETGERMITELVFFVPEDSEALRMIIDDTRTPPKASREIADYTTVEPERRMRVRRRQGPTEQTRRRADLFKSLKDENPDRGQYVVAMLATLILQGEGELAFDERITPGQVAYAYRRMGWRWPRGKRTR